MTIEAMKQALEALEFEAEGWECVPPITREAIAVLRAAIDQAQEPVAWMWADGTLTADPDRADGTWKPLYTAPRQWQGLTDDEIKAASLQAGMQEHYMGFHSGFIRFARAIEAAHGITREQS